MEDGQILYKLTKLEKLIFRNLCFSKGRLIKRKMLPPTQMQIIEYILNNMNKDIYQKDLENVLNLRRATVSGVLKTMEKNNLIERVKNEDDVRGKKIILNASAKNVFLQGKEKLKKIEGIAIKDISKQEIDVFCNILEKMKKNIEESGEKDA